jgi:putative NIF3 family GTP cyclohydrolase 1 type 2
MANPVLKAVCRAMERIAPLRLAESWDNVRLGPIPSRVLVDRSQLLLTR